jgi:hypothetical protein
MANRTKSGVKQRTAGILGIIAKTIGALVLAFFLTIVIGEIVMSCNSSVSQGATWESLFILVPIIIALAAYIIAWWRELLGGILLIVSYLVLSFSPSVHSIFYGTGFSFFSGMFLYALPFLVAGVLFLLTDWLGGRGRAKA